MNSFENLPHDFEQKKDQSLNIHYKGLAQNLLSEDSFGKGDLMDSPIDINTSHEQPVMSEQYRELTLNEPIKETIVFPNNN